MPKNRKMCCFSFWTHCMACGILVSQPMIKPETPAIQVQSLNHWTAREVPKTCFVIGKISKLHESRDYKEPLWTYPDPTTYALPFLFYQVPPTHFLRAFKFSLKQISVIMSFLHLICFSKGRTEGRKMFSLYDHSAITTVKKIMNNS